ncbi:hypothetical protein D3H55_16340 [Bacillus salacetis]|uniref:Uncharacterized protein n=1 Tax=Bacillus salacetis TaxID=2315464 RepID=A0A3A1QVP4_9BACI|nr:hypothetical protein D3H55_16340 [Bacillus salacetis]
MKHKITKKFLVFCMFQSKAKGVIHRTILINTIHFKLVPKTLRNPLSGSIKKKLPTKQPFKSLWKAVKALPSIQEKVPCLSVNY